MAAPPTPKTIAAAVAQGNYTAIQQLIANNHDVNKRSPDGMTPLGLAAFWGYSDIVSLLLQSNADINGTNAGTNWTPLHCAAFQDHGKVIMKLMEYNPRVDIRDHQGRTAVDFASALDSIWPFFAGTIILLPFNTMLILNLMILARNCKRTHKSELLRMNIITKVSC
ncbi:DgyrCDS11279 [Dimorphilus gyrociliatus]|uniref:DgyrCDS11279 n=1 Tax=Dimorphilus gyrociliatus TaxID=2664684 RepID=A0A7I8W3U8_9ANNE|nr:DgyrCDS11279 [Dimorphilus gyrociliatus]